MPSPLESLPLEILHHIFFFSPNLSLPLSSPRLGLLFSSNHVFNWLLTSILGPEDYTNAIMSEVASAQDQALLKENPDDTLTDAIDLDGLQMQLLGLRWVTAERFTAAFPNRQVLKHLSCEYPLNLLHGPWTKAKVDLLNVLLKQTHCVIPTREKAYRDALAQGRMDAIRERNWAAVKIFIRERTFGSPPGLEEVKVAVTEGGCDRKIVASLIRSAWMWGVKRWDSEELDAWMEERKGEEDAEWLRGLLEDVRGGVWREDEGKQIQSHSARW